MLRSRTRIVSLVLAVLALLVLSLPAVADEGDESGSGEGSTAIAASLTSEFGITEEEALDLHGSGLGWGDLFKLGLYSAVTGEEIEAILATAVFGENGEFEFSWGEWFKGLEPEQFEALDGFARNLGQLISADKRGHGRPDHAVGPDGKDENPGKGNGGTPPGHARKEGPDEGSGD